MEPHILWLASFLFLLQADTPKKKVKLVKRLRSRIDLPKQAHTSITPS